MPFLITCTNPACAHATRPLRVETILAGKKIRCPGCASILNVPTGAPASASGLRINPVWIVAACVFGLVVVVGGVAIGLALMGPSKILPGTLRPPGDPVAAKDGPVGNKDDGSNWLERTEAENRKKCETAQADASEAHEKIKNIDPGQSIGLTLKKIDATYQDGVATMAKGLFLEAQDIFTAVSRLCRQVAQLDQQRTATNQIADDARAARDQAEKEQIATEDPDTWAKIGKLDQQAKDDFEAGRFDKAETGWKAAAALSNAAVKEAGPRRTAHQAQMALEAELKKYNRKALAANHDKAWLGVADAMQKAEAAQKERRYADAASAFAAAQKRLATRQKALPAKKLTACIIGYAGQTAANVRGANQTPNDVILTQLELAFKDLDLDTQVITQARSDRTSTNATLTDRLATTPLQLACDTQGNELAASGQFGIMLAKSVIGATNMANGFDTQQLHMDLLLELTTNAARRADCAPEIVARIDKLRGKLKSIKPAQARDVGKSIQVDLESLWKQMRNPDAATKTLPADPPLPSKETNPVEKPMEKKEAPAKTVKQLYEEEAQQVLESAKKFYKDGMLDLCRARLRITIDDYPTTPAAREAEQLHKKWFP